MNRQGIPGVTGGHLAEGRNGNPSIPDHCLACFHKCKPVVARPGNGIPACYRQAIISSRDGCPITRHLHGKAAGHREPSAFQEVARLLDGAVEEDQTLAELYEAVLLDEVSVVNFENNPTRTALPVKVSWMLAR
jgi:hypothetical protein